MPSFREWVQKYKDKSPFPIQLRLSDSLEFDPGRGFMLWKYFPEQGAIYVTEVCGDIVHWVGVIKARAVEIGAKKIMAVSNRDPKAYEFITGSKLVGHLFMLEV